MSPPLFEASICLFRDVKHLERGASENYLEIRQHVQWHKTRTTIISHTLSKMLTFWTTGVLTVLMY